MTVESSARLVLCGDFNCPRKDGQINDNLDDVLTSCGLQQHVLQPTRDHNLLDIVATSDPEVVQDVCVVSSGDASDHCLITAKLQSRQPPPPPVQSTYRALKRLNLGDFEASLRCSALFTQGVSRTSLTAHRWPEQEMSKRPMKTKTGKNGGRQLILFILQSQLTTVKCRIAA